MKYIRILLTLVLGIVYWPIMNLNEAVTKWYLRMKKEDKIIYYCFMPFYWILVTVTFIVSVPYEFVISVDLH